jgi:hypothetical protein
MRGISSGVPAALRPHLSAAVFRRSTSPPKRLGARSRSPPPPLPNGEPMDRRTVALHRVHCTPLRAYKSRPKSLHFATPLSEHSSSPLLDSQNAAGQPRPLPRRREPFSATGHRAETRKVVLGLVPLYPPFFLSRSSPLCAKIIARLSAISREPRSRRCRLHPSSSP